MTGVIIRKELQDIIRSRKFAISFSLVALLIILAFYGGADNYFLQQRRYEAARAENIRQMQGITDWRKVKNRIFLPPDSLYTLVNGISNDVGRDIEVYGAGELQAANSFFSENPLFAVFRFPDLEFIFGIILSLYAIMFGYNMINREKESGTLRLVFANPVPRAGFILGKLSGAFLAVTIPLLLPVLIGCLLLMVMGVPMNESDWLRLGLIIMTGMLFFSLFLTMAIFISALTHRPSSAFLVLLVIWIFSVLIIPRTAVLLADKMVEVPSVDETASQKFRYRMQLLSEEMKKLRVYKPNQGMEIRKQVNEFQQYMEDLSNERNNKMAAFNRKVNQERLNRQRIRENLAFSLARISPAAAFSLAVMNLAGTSIGLEQAFYDAADAYQEAYAAFLKTKFEGPIPGPGVVFSRITDKDDEKPIDPSEVPVFLFPPPLMTGLMRTAIIDLSILACLNMFFFIGAVMAFLHYDVR